MSARRDFIKQLGLLGLGGLLIPQGLQAAFKKPFPVGLQLYTLRDVIGKDIDKIIAQIAKMGYTEVETFAYNNKTGYFGWKTKDFAQLLADHGIKAPSGHFEFAQYFLNKGDRQVSEAIEASDILGSKFVTVPWLDPPVRKTLDDYKLIAEKLNVAGTMAAKAGMKIAYHNHEFEFRKKGDQNGFEVMLKETDPKLVDFELDLYWLLYSGYDPIEFIKSHPKRFTMWHLKDMSFQNKDWNTEIGKGKLPVKELFKLAKSSGLKHCFVEQETNYKPNEIESVKASADFIRNLKV